MGCILEGVVAYSAITDPIRCFPKDPAFYVVFLTNEKWLFGKMQPRLYDRARQPMPPQPISRGSTVRLSVDDDNWLHAVQIVELADDCPFEIAAQTG